MYFAFFFFILLLLLVRKRYKFPTEKQQNRCQKPLNSDFSIESNIVSCRMSICTRVRVLLRCLHCSVALGIQSNNIYRKSHIMLHRMDDTINNVYTTTLWRWKVCCSRVNESWGFFSWAVRAVVYIIFNAEFYFFCCSSRTKSSNRSTESLRRSETFPPKT